MIENVAPTDLPVWVIVLIPLAFIVVFPLFWCFVVWLLSRISGWSRLAERFATTAEPDGNVYPGLQGRIGLVSYRGVLDAVTNEKGMYLRPGFLFRCGHPLLFIPWDEFRNLRKRNILGIKAMRADLGDSKVATVQLPKKVFAKLLKNDGDRPD